MLVRLLLLLLLLLLTFLVLDHDFGLDDGFVRTKLQLA